MTALGDRTIGVIPARYAATRFPGKLLQDLNGRTVLERVYRRAAQAKSLDLLLVATDDDRIRRAVAAFGGNAVMTSARPRTGTERVAEACRKIPAKLVVNIQGDEPFLRPEMIDLVVAELKRDPLVPVATLRKEIEDPEELSDPNTVKVVTDLSGLALYFSRSLIPSGGMAPRGKTYKHIGLYGYRKYFLMRLVRLPPSELEKREHLEQLRVLENGYKIRVLTVRWETVGVDTPEDLEKARKLIRQKSEGRSRKWEVGSGKCRKWEVQKLKKTG
ncbi:MAG: 3-deoxy-manno-octulosonate cytidylyltransferase [Candidatus Aureabacteria bacterium]|nr:3-deoxy-manno-octulosonate cytidylyltransferase [Candidatus Auribacterota bacterium]